VNVKLAAKAPPLAPGEFRFITKAVQMEPPGEDGKRRFKMVASSTVIDQGKDELKLSALHDLENAFKRGLNIFTDHDHKVDNVFGRTDTATVMDSGERDPKTGAPIFDLHVAGVVNEPDPRMVRLANSIDGGYVTFGASIGAIVKEHQRNKAGGMDIYHVDGKEASLVGIPMNQRSWTYKAAKAAEALDTASDIDDEDEPEEVEKAAPEPEAPLTPEVVKTDDLDTAESDDAAASTSPETPDGQESDSAPEPPETASEDVDAEDQTDTPETEKAAYPAAEVKELLSHVSQLVAHIGEQDAIIADLRTKVAAYEAEAGAITKEVDLAKEVIEKVMAQPLRSKTAGYVEDFTRTHSLFDPTIAEYLDKRSKLSHD
jgi:hypothetical protein